MGMLALPALVQSHQQNPDRGAGPRLNVVIALLSVAALGGGIPFVRVGWGVLYPHAPFPIALFLLLSAGYGFSVGCGLPDRMLQSAGRAEVVARYGLITALALPVVSVAATLAIGLSGAAAAFLVAIAFVNIIMLVDAGVRGQMLVAHVVLVALVLLAAAASLVRVGIVSSSVVSLLTLGIVAGLGAVWRGPLWGSRVKSS
jgi:hypothetical protein